MTNTVNLQAAEEVIMQNIIPNGVKAITAEILQEVLLEITTAAEKDIDAVIDSTLESVNDFVFNTNNYGNLSVTTPKIADSAITTGKLGDASVTKVKLSSDVTDYLLTPAMKEYLLSKIDTDRQKEAQERFNGYTQNGGDTSFIYGETSAANAGKTVRVTLSFDGVAVEADNIPCGWTKVDGGYEYDLSLNMGNRTAPATIFTYTPKTGIYSGCTVTYESEAASVEWINPVFYGFAPDNSEGSITRDVVNRLKYSTIDVVDASATLRNELPTEGYLCILTKNVATATQLGISIIDCAKNAPNFTSPKNSSVTMSGYYVYFGKNPVASGSSLGNVNLSILK